VLKHTELKSSKYYQFLIFEKAVKLFLNKEHLTSKGKKKILEYYNDMKDVNRNSTARKNMEIDKY